MPERSARLYLRPMATVTETSLSALERETLDRFIELLTDELGDDLVSVWLYGSRARGEPPEPESDVDVLVLTRGDVARAGARASQAIEAAAEATGASPFFFSVMSFDLEWLAERRSIEADFIREVDRDRVVLAGDEQGDEPPPLRPFTGMRPRTREYLDQAERRLRIAKLGLGADVAEPLISLGYYAMFYAARAALSEQDVFVRSHKGQWGLFHRTFVAGGEFDPLLAQAAAATQKPREYADYEARPFSEQQARQTLELADRFVAAVKELIGE